MDEFEIKNEDEQRAFNDARLGGYRKRDARREAITILVSLATAIAVGVSVVQFFIAARVSRRDSADSATVLQENISSLQKRLDAITASLANGPQKAPDAAMANLAAQLQQVQEDMQAFKSVLGDSPSKTLALPIMRKDIDDLKQRYHDDITAIRDESTRTLDAIKWIVGLLVASNVGMGYLALTKGKSP